mgnify:CR=1 FL=1
MSKIPTAEEFLVRMKKMQMPISEIMKGFTKRHVEAALKEAEIAGQNNWGNSKKMKDAILNAYPLTNIK